MEELAAQSAPGAGRAGRRPPLSVVIPVRGDLEEMAPVFEALLPQAAETGTEVVIAADGEVKPPAGEAVRVVVVPSSDMLVLRRRSIEEARGEVIAIGEDHAVPRPEWCSAVIRAHAEHPEAAAVVGCLVNATDETITGRANFLAFAAAWQPPMPALPAGRPPPASALTFKREALEPIREEPLGWMEAELIPSLFERGLMAVDERVVVDHHQDHGGLWSIRNAYDSARSSYGHSRLALSPPARRTVARWAIANIPRQLRGEARAAMSGHRAGVVESVLISTITLAAGVGGAAGTLLGPGRSAARVA